MGHPSVNTGNYVFDTADTETFINSAYCSNCVHGFNERDSDVHVTQMNTLANFTTMANYTVSAV